MRLEINIRKSDGTCTLSLRGELDIATADELGRALVRVEQSRPKTIVLDLRDLDFIDSSGLRVIVAADAGARREGRRVVIVEGPEPVRRVFRHTLLDRRLNLVEDPEEIDRRA